MSKQDRQGVRTPADLEQKYRFGKRFAEILGIATDARDSVAAVETSLRSEILEQVTSITRDTERIIMTALESYVERGELEELQATFESEFLVMAERIAMNFESTETKITNVDGDLQSVIEKLEKHFDFDVNGLTIKAGENDMRLRIDNDIISFYRGEIDESDLEKNRFGWWDGVDFHTGNIMVDLNERAQFGNFAFVPRSNGSLDFLKVGG
jgi:hypothetical protein